jgi:signal transduction protein with GAF and PtsI domain
LRIGSSTYEDLRRNEVKPKIVTEERKKSARRPAVQIGRDESRVSDSVLEDVFLEIQEIHEREMEMEDVVNFVMDMAMDKVLSESGAILFADVTGLELYFATARGPKANEVMDFRVPMGKGIVGFCAREGVSLAISEAERDPRFYRKISQALGYATQSLCCAPIQFEGRVYGAIELMNKRDSQFSGAEVSVLTYMGRQLAKYVHDLIMDRETLSKM